MRNPANVLHGPRDMRMEDRPVPVPGPGEVLVRIRSVGICGSDIHYYEEGRIGEHVVTAPLVLGHEASGVVVSAGEGAGRHPEGTRVALEPGVPCGRCARCREGRYNLCPDVSFFATPPVDGTFTEYVTLHEDFAHRLPDGMSDDAGALTEPLNVAVWACRKAGVGLGSRVAVSGAGPVGALVAAVARASGAASVVVSDVNPARLARTASYGATATLDARAGSFRDLAEEPDVFIECSGSAAAAADGVRAVRRAGTVVLVGMGATTLDVPVDVVQNRELWLTGTFRYANTYPGALALAASGAVDLDGLVDAVFPLDEAEAALTAGRRDPDLMKAVVRVTEAG